MRKHCLAPSDVRFKLQTQGLGRKAFSLHGFVGPELLGFGGDPDIKRHSDPSTLSRAHTYSDGPEEPFFSRARITPIHSHGEAGIRNSREHRHPETLHQELRTSPKGYIARPNYSRILDLQIRLLAETYT